MKIISSWLRDVIDPIFHMFKVPFITLNEWNMVSKNTQRVNIYINLENIFRLVIVPTNEDFVQSIIDMEDKKRCCDMLALDFISNIINVAEHYKLWAAKNDYDCNVFLYWNFPVSSRYKNFRSNTEYRVKHNDRYSKSNHFAPILVDTIHRMYDFLRGCIKYIRGIYLIDPLSNESSIIPLLIDRKVYNDGKKTSNILITSSLYEYSYTKYGFNVINIFAYSNTTKTRRPSILLTKENVFEGFRLKCGIKRIKPLSANFADFVVALLGDDDRNMVSPIGIGLATAMDIAILGIRFGKITNDTKDVDTLTSVVPALYQDIFERNYLCSNFELQLEMVEPVELHKIKGCIVDLYDDNVLKEMNDKYFKFFPINLIRPMSEQVFYEEGRSEYNSRSSIW